MVRNGKGELSLDTIVGVIEQKGLSPSMVGVIGQDPQAQLILHFLGELNQESIQVLRHLEK